MVCEMTDLPDEALCWWTEFILPAFSSGKFPVECLVERNEQTMSCPIYKGSSGKLKIANTCGWAISEPLAHHWQNTDVRIVTGARYHPEYPQHIRPHSIAVRSLPVLLPD